MRPALVVTTLGIAQTLAWASTYYLPAMLAMPMAAELGLGTAVVYACVSAALIISALVGPAAGRLIDRHGGRSVLMVTSLLFAAGLTVLGLSQGLWSLMLAWAIIGLAMGSGLYEAAFSSLVRLYGEGARGAITGITLFAGFASTVGWPLSAWMEAHFGWRGACLGWAGLHVFLGLPLNAWFPRDPATSRASATASTPAAVAAAPQAPVASKRAAESGKSARFTSTHALLAFVFASTWFISTAMATHLPRLLGTMGIGLAAAVAIGALIGPAQVAGRALEFVWLQRLHPLLSARMAALCHPLGAGLLLLMGPVAAPVFALLHGAGNGILTITNGTLPLAMFGSGGYGARQGWLMLPSRIAQASAPVLFGLAVDAWGSGALWLSGAMGLAVLGALLCLRARPAAAAAALGTTR
ncbi:MAG: MFS transporter [Castellaniella sp.]